MRILIIYRHFWPDSPPYASLLRSIAGRLVRDGHQVEIWTEQPGYKSADTRKRAPRREQLDGIRVERFSRLPLTGHSSTIRLIDKLVFPFRSLVKGVFRKLGGSRYDLVWTATIPPVLSGMTNRWIAKLFGARSLYNCLDLYPEIAIHMGWLRENGLVAKCMRAVESGTRRNSDIIVTLSNDMVGTITEMVRPEGRVAVINNFMLEEFETNGARSAGDAQLPSRDEAMRVGARPLRMIFAGNLGLFQGLDRLVEAMRIVDRAGSCPGLELTFLGEGKALPSLKKLAQGLGNVTFEPHRPYEEARALIHAADVGIVSLEAEIYRLAFPSKTLTYLGLGLPVLTIVEPDSELSAMIRTNGLGWVSASREPEAIAETVELMHRSYENGEDLRRHVLAWFNDNLSKDALLDRWSEEISSLAVAQASASGSRPGKAG